MKKLSFFLIVSLLVIGCKKDNLDTYTRAAKDSALGEQLISEVLREVLVYIPNYVINQNYSGNDGLFITSSPEITESSYPKRISLNYGDGIDGDLLRKKEGKIIVTINSGTVISENLYITFEDFKSEGTKILGHINYNYNQSNSGYDGELPSDGMSFINANGTMKLYGIFSFSKNSTQGTVDLKDDFYNFTCNTNGIDFNQTQFTYVSTSNHLIDFSCNNYIKSGRSNLKPNGKNIQTVDFGSQNCDKNASITTSDGTIRNFTF